MPAPAPAVPAPAVARKSMASPATKGALIEVTPWDDLQYWPSRDSGWTFVADRMPFRFRVSGELIDDGFFFGLHGPVESGPSR